MKSSIRSPQVKTVLDALYKDAWTNDPLIRQALMAAGENRGNSTEHFKSRKNLYMPVNPQFGDLIYSLARSSKAKTVVEFGTSFGISTIFLASAVQDNGGGKVITTEFIPEKAEKAEKNIEDTGLNPYVEYRVGDALETLKKDLPQEIDLVFLDGAKDLYLSVLKLLEPRLKPGAVIVSDNTDHDGIEPFLEYLRSPNNGYVSTAILTLDRGQTRAHEISTRV